jgi:Pyruvate/2-oxoacid:ferredoxin oxidoreductase delta subunit
MRVTPTALVGSWVPQLIEGMTFLGTDFEKRTKWQGYIDEPTAKDFVARKVRTIKLTKVLGTSWIAIKCKECLRSCPAAVVRQATINLYSQIWKSL